MQNQQNDLVYRLRKRAEIRRQILGRKSVEEGKPDRIADILEEAADAIADEREACAKVCEELVPHPSKVGNEASVWDVAIFDCATAIRARSNT